MPFGKDQLRLNDLSTGMMAASTGVGDMPSDVSWPASFRKTVSEAGWSAWEPGD